MLTAKLENSASRFFLVDGMLGTTARKLRILGYDTIYDSKSSDKDLLHLAISTGRSLVTSDYQLFINARTARVNAILVRGRSEQERLFEVLSKSGVRDIPLQNLVSRCSVCNGELQVAKEKTHNETKIFSCKTCGKKYWRGGHWRKMSELFRSVNAMLSEYN
jgi:uncharacterized protein